MTCPGTLLYAADDILDELEKEDSLTAIQPSPHHDMAALVKCVYMIVHPTALVAAAALTEIPQHIHVRAAEIKKFWDNELCKRTGPGREWRSLLGLAHACKGDGYGEAVLALRQQLVNHVRGVE